MEEPSAVFGRIWSEYGFSIQDDRAALLNIVVYDPDFDQIFIGNSRIHVDRNSRFQMLKSKKSFCCRSYGSKRTK